jgi:hypothetical protein
MQLALSLAANAGMALAISIAAIIAITARTEKMRFMRCLLNCRAGLDSPAS